MKFRDGHVTELKIAYIGGGSRGWAWGFMTGLAMEEQLSGTVVLYDIDEQAAKQNEIIGNKMNELPGAVGKWDYVTAASLKEALTGADFVVISILPGTFDEMYSDVHLPERLGIYQSVGDTAGPGGIIRALRTIPMFVEIAEAVKMYSPEAWVINYTNPMTLCVKALYETFPEIKAFGCCHEVFGTQKFLRMIVEQKYGYKDIDWHDILVNVIGINHFTWFDKASYKGIDLFPIYQEYVEENYETGYDAPDLNWMNSVFECAHRVKMDLFKRYGYIAAAGDRHLAEFMPSNEYLKNPETVKEWRFGLTSVEWRKEDLRNRLERSERLINGSEIIELKETGEEGVMLMKALLGLERLVSNVNIPNTYGQLPNLPRTAVVETNAIFEKDHIYPVIAGNVPKNILELLKPHVENHEMVMKAALTCDRELVYKAFLNDPLVIGAGCNEADIHKLADDMIENTLAYLPEGWKK